MSKRTSGPRMVCDMSVRFPPELMKQIQTLADFRKISRGEAIRQILKEYFDGHKEG